MVVSVFVQVSCRSELLLYSMKTCRRVDWNASELRKAVLDKMWRRVPPVDVEGGVMDGLGLPMASAR